jgi:hypothetical protein
MRIQPRPRRGVLIGVLLPFCLTTIASGQQQPPIMGVGLARRILTAALSDKGITKRPGFDLEYYDGKIPGFYFFGADWDTPRSSMAAGTGHYAVNRVTGDIWEVPGCGVVSSRHADKLKVDVAKWMHLSKEDYAKAAKLRPCPYP